MTEIMKENGCEWLKLWRRMVVNDWNYEGEWLWMTEIMRMVVNESIDEGEWLCMIGTMKEEAWLWIIKNLKEDGCEWIKGIWCWWIKKRRRMLGINENMEEERRQ